jgi:type IV fimbrial biogenesis protein FimT
MLAVKDSRLSRALARGFTLIEMMVVLSILAIFATIAIPSVRGMAANQALSDSSGELLASLQNARNAAVSNGRSVILEPTGTSWSGGWRAYIDNNVDSTFNGTDTLILSKNAMSESLSTSGSFTAGACGSTIASTSSAGSFTFSANGFLRAGATNGVIYLTSSDSPRSRCIVVSLSGRARSCETGAYGSPC